MSLLRQIKETTKPFFEHELLNNSSAQSEENLKYLISYECRTQENVIDQHIPLVLSQVILAFLKNISMIFKKTNNSNSFESIIITPTIMALQQYQDLEFELMNLKYARKICIGICKPNSNAPKKVWNNKSFFGLIINKNTIYRRSRGSMISYEDQRLKANDIIRVHHTIAEGKWEIFLHSIGKTAQTLFYAYSLSMETHQMLVCFFDQEDSVCMSHIHARKPNKENDNDNVSQKINDNENDNDNDSDIDVDTNNNTSVRRSRGTTSGMPRLFSRHRGTIRARRTPRRTQ